MRSSRRNGRHSRVPGGLAVGASVALAAVSCKLTRNVNADPSPPPFNCDEVSSGQHLQAYAFLEDSVVTAIVSSYQGAFLDTVTVTGLEGFALESLTQPPDDNTVWLRLQPDPPEAKLGRFTLSGRLRVGRYADEECTVSRTFTVTIHGDTVDVARRIDPVPLECRDRARIQVVSRHGLTVQLAATGSKSTRLSWSASAGKLSDGSAEHVTWTLPATPGFHQVQLLTDHGDRGFGFDSLVIEVG